MNKEEEGREVVKHFKVLWKTPDDSKARQEDFISSDLKELMHALKSQGVSHENVEYLYVHYHPRPRGDVVEVVAIDNRDKEDKKHQLVEALVKDQEEKQAAATKSKPRVRLKTPLLTQEKKRHTVKQGLYTAAEW